MTSFLSLRSFLAGLWSPVRRMSCTNKVLLAVSLVLLCALPWYRINMTRSAAQGVWRLAALPPRVERGMWVVLPVPASVNSRVRGYRTLLKQVAAVAGDWVCVEDGTLWIITDRGTSLEHGMNYGLVDHARHGMPVPHLEDGCFALAAQEVFLASPPAPALDSRHFNAVPVSSLTAQAFPLLTWR